MKQHLPDKEIASAGIGALVGNTADKSTIAIAEKHQLSLEGHEARKLTKEMCREYSLILVIDKGHIDAVCRLAPEVRGKTMLFAHWLGQKEIPDPYRKSAEAYEFVYRLLYDTAQKWA